MPIWNHFGDRQSLLARLVIRYRDGATDVVTSNARDWKYFAGGPVVYSSLDMGEVYDARKEAAIHGWSDRRLRRSGLEDARARSRSPGPPSSAPSTDRFGRATTMSYDRMSLVGQIGESPGVFKTLTAKSVREVRDGVYVYDMGQNFVGVPRITFAEREGRPQGRPESGRDAVSRSRRVREERRHDHDRELPGGARARTSTS